MEKKLNAKMSNFQTHLSFNEWVKEFNVSRDYVTPTPFFKNNPKENYHKLTEQKPEPVVSSVRRLAVSILDKLAIFDIV